MRSELVCRRHDWKEGFPVTFGDGREWSVRRPSVRFAPSVEPGPDGEFGADVLHVYEGDRTIRQTARDVEGAENGRERLKHLYRLASALLRLNYDLSADELAELLGFDVNDQAGGLALLKCHAVAVNREPTAVEAETEAGAEPVTAEAVPLEATP